MIRFFTDLEDGSPVYLFGHMFLTNLVEELDGGAYQVRPIKRPAAWDIELLPDYLAKLLKEQSRVSAKPMFEVYNGTVATLADYQVATYPGTSRVAVTSWERKKLPKPFARALDKLDLVVVPSRRVADVFKAAGVRNVQVYRPCTLPVETEKVDDLHDVHVIGGRWLRAKPLLTDLLAVEPRQHYHVACFDAPNLGEKELGKDATRVSQSSAPTNLEQWAELARHVRKVVVWPDLEPIQCLFERATGTEPMTEALQLLEEHQRPPILVRSGKVAPFAVFTASPSIPHDQLALCVDQVREECERVVVAVMSASLETTSAYARECKRRFNAEFVHVEHPSVECDWSLARARNAGARRAIELGAEALMFIDADVVMPFGAVTWMMQLLYGDVIEYKTGQAVVTCQVIRGDKPLVSPTVPVADFPMPARPLKDYAIMERVALPKIAEKALDLADGVLNYLGREPIKRPERAATVRAPDADWSPTRPATGIALVRQEAFRAVNGYDETFLGYGAEDVDFIDRIKKAGFLWFQALDVMAYHLPHEPRQYKGSKFEQQNERRTHERMAASQGGVVNPEGWGEYQEVGL